jgi:hypothetical protein
MIPQDYITAWSRIAPWANQRQVEQDLIISRTIVTIFSDPFLRGELRFRGGTALNKLHFPTPLRYSEDNAGDQTAGFASTRQGPRPFRPRSRTHRVREAGHSPNRQMFSALP